MSDAARALNPSPRDNLLLHPGGALGYGGDAGEEDRCTNYKGARDTTGHARGWAIHDSISPWVLGTVFQSEQEKLNLQMRKPRQ